MLKFLNMINLKRKFLRIIFSLFLVCLTNHITAQSTSTEKIITSGITYLDYFYPPNSPNQNQFYTGLSNGVTTLISLEGNTSANYTPLFTRISNMVYYSAANTFYLCPIDNGMIWQMVSDLSKVNGETNYDTDSDSSITGLRCSVDNQEDYFYIAYIGFNAIYSFQFKINSYNPIFTFGTNEVIIGFHTPDDRKASQTFYILTNNDVNKQYYLRIRNYPTTSNSTDFEYYYQEMPLYDNIEMSLNTIMPQVIIFSYSHTNFSYFFIDSSSGVIVKSEVSGSLFGMSGITVANAKFVTNSELLMYKAVYNGNNTNFYGVGDVFQDLSLFKQQKDVDSVNYFPVNSTDQLIAISENSNFESVYCPFVKTDGQTTCTIDCSTSGMGYYFDTTDNVCKNCQNLNKVFYVRYCLDSCPYGLHPDQTSTCVKCSGTTPYYDGTQSACVSSCPDYYGYDIYNVCYKCISSGKYYDATQKVCVLACQTNWISDINNGSCEFCKDSNLYYCGNPHQCCTECPPYQVYDSNNVCYDCKSVNKFYVYSKKVCVDKCPSNSAVDNVNSRCDICMDNNPSQYYIPSNNTCLDACPEYFLSNSTTNVCYTCKENGQFYNYGECVGECPAGSSVNETSMMCTSCQKEGKYLRNNICVTSCDSDELYDANSICYTCKGRYGMFFDSNSKQCVSQCPAGSAIDETNMICTLCKASGQYLSNNTCLNNCPNRTVVTTDNICYSCKDNYEYYIDPDGVCAQSCPSYMQIDTGNFYCVDCKAKGLYNMNNTCKSSCDAYYIPDANNTCYNCKLDRGGEYLINDTCVSQCPNGSKVDTVNNVCYYCGGFNQYYYKAEQKCVNKCPDTYLANPSRVCYQCKDVGQFYYNGSCYSSCFSYCAVDSKSNTCDCCVDSGLYLTNNTCANACPGGSIIQTNNTCETCRYEGKYLRGEECVSACESYDAVDEENKICYDCVANNQYLNPKDKSKCVDSCGSYTRVLADNVCSSCLDEPVNKYYLDKGNPKTSVCVESCPDYSAPVAGNKACISCKDINMWFFNSKCQSGCTYCQEANNVCVYCNDCQKTGKIKYLNGCVSACPTGSVANSKNECIRCMDGGGSGQNLTPFFLVDKCVASCPDGYTYTDNNVCTICNGYIYKNVCLPNCPYLFGTLEPKSKICHDCKGLNKYLYGISCVDTCPTTTTLDADNGVCNSVVKQECVDNCNSHGACDQSKGQCVCDQGYTGDYCEVYIKSNDTYFSIVPLNKIVKTSTNSFTFKFNNQKYSTNQISLYWDVNTITNESAYLTGRTQTILKLEKNALNNGLNVVTLFMLDENLKAFYRAVVELNIKSLDPSRFSCNAKYYLNEKEMDYGISMKSLVVVEVSDTKAKAVTSLRQLQGSNSEIFIYKFYYVDSYGEQLEITSLDITTSTFARTLPITNKLIVQVQDNIGNTISFSYPLDIRRDENYDQSVDGLLTNSGTTPNQKLINIYNYMNQKNDSLSASDVKTISNFLSNSFNDVMTNKNSTISQSSILAVFNQLVVSQSKNKTSKDSLASISNLNNMIKYFTTTINSDPNPNAVSREDLKSYYRSLDFMFDALDNLNYTAIPGSAATGSKEIDEVENSIQNINQYLSRSMDPNERVVISTKNFDSYIERPSTSQKLISLNEVNKSNNNYSTYNDYTLENTQKTGSCGSNTYLCVDQQNMQTFQKNIKYKEGINMDNIAFFAINLNNKNKYNGKDTSYKPLSTTSFSTDLYNVNTNSTLNNTSYFSYDVTLNIPPNTTENVTSNSACVSIDNANKPTTSCQTFYNYTSFKTICKCTGTGEVVNFYSYTLSNLAKLFQFPNWSMQLINPLSMCIILGSLSITILFSIVLLFYDYYDDRNFLSSNKLNDHQIIHNEFKDLTSLCHANTFSFALYVTMYIYPFFSVFSIYNYNQPRFLRFCVQMISILMSMCFSLLPYYKVPFTYQTIFIDKRNIEESNWSVDNLPSKISDILSTLVYSIFASIIITIILTIFSYLMKWSDLMLKVWKYRKDIINRYVRQYLIKSLSLPEKWKMLRNRILALNAICGKWILKNYLKREEERKKQMSFMKIFDKEITESTLKQRLIKDNNKNKDVSLELRDMGSFIRGSMGSNFSFRRHESCNMNDGLLYITKAENLSLNIEKNDKKARKKMEKMKEILSMYFKKQKCPAQEQIFAKRYDSSMLRMFRLKQISVFSIKSNRILLQKFKEEKINIIKSIFAVFLLFASFFFLYFLLVMLISDIYYRYRYYILKVWLFPSLIQLFLVRFLIIYCLNFFKSYLLFKHYAMRKTKCFIKLLYTLFVTKDVIYMYRIRNFITKYEKELKEVKKKKEPAQTEEI